MYDPSTARFLTKDPLEERGGSPNLYLYCFNDPINNTDPSGQGHPEDRLRPGSRISNLLVHDDQVAEVTKRLSDALGVTVQTVPGPPKSGYTYIVLPPEALNEAGHAKIVAALAPYQLSNKDVQDNLADALRAIYRGNITNPPGYTDRYLVTDPLTGKGYVSTTADFGASQISGDLSDIPPARLKALVKDGLAQDVGGYIYVAWIDPATKQVNQMVFEPTRAGVEVVAANEGGAVYRDIEESAIGREPRAGDYYKLVKHSYTQLTGGIAELDASFKRITSSQAAQTAVEAVKTAKKGRRYEDYIRASDTALKGVKLAAEITPILGTTIKAIEGNAEEAIISGIGDASLLIGLGALDKVNKARKLSIGWRVSVGVSIGADISVAGYNVVKGVKDVQNDEYWKAAAHFGEAGLRLVGITPGVIALRRSNAYAKARAEAAKEAERAAAERAAAERSATGAEFDINTLTSASLGEPLGEGTFKVVRKVIGRDDLAVGVLKPEANPQVIADEIVSINALKEKGLPVVEVIGTTKIDDVPVIVYKRYAAGSKDIIKYAAGGRPVVTKSPYLNQRSIDDLNAIKKQLVEGKIKISDLGFLIDKNGRVVIADPGLIRAGEVRGPTLKIIDDLIEAARVSMQP